MKFILLLLSLSIGNLNGFAQENLDSIITVFSQKNNLYNKKLKSVEKSRLRVIKFGRGKDKWEDAYNNWYGDSKDSINFETLFMDYLKLETSTRSQSRHGYSIEYLTHRIDQCVIQKKLSQQNGMVLKNVLMRTVDQDIVRNEIKQIQSSILSSAPSKYYKSSIVTSFIKNYSDSKLSSSPYSIYEVVKNYTKEDRKAFKDYMILNGFRMEDLSETLPQPNKSSLSICASSFSVLLYNPEAITHLEKDDFLKYQVYLENTIIRDFFFCSFLFAEWRRQELEDLDSREFSKKMNVEQREFPSRLFMHLEYSLNYNLDGFGLRDTAICTFDQLLILAYNDIYLNLRPSTSVKFRRAEKRIDFTNFNLSNSERRIIDGILSDSLAITENYLIASIDNEFLATSNWNVEFKLACYIALYYKSLDQSRGWNKGRYITNPFEKNQKHYKEVIQIEDSQWEIFKQNCYSELAELGRISDRLVVTFNSQGKHLITPSVNRSVEIKIGRAISKHITWSKEPSYFRIVLEFDNQPTLTKHNSNVPIGNNVYPAAPPIVNSSSTNTTLTKPAGIVDFPDIQASFPGGNINLKKWIKENLNYPETSKELGDEGTVYVVFVVEVDGSITGVDIHRKGITKELNNEAKRIIMTMPPWIPGEVNGVKVRTRCRVPIRFVLSDS